MGAVIRDAIIRLKIEQQKAKLETPEVATVRRGFEEQKKAAAESAKAVQENAKAVRDVQDTHVEFGRQSLRSFRDAGQGVMQLTRGIALMGAAGTEDTRKLLENLVKIEAALVLAKGAANLGKFAASFGPVGYAVAAVTAAVTVGAAAWKRYTGEVEAAKKANEDFRKSMESVRVLGHEAFAGARGKELATAEMRSRYMSGTPDEANRDMRTAIERAWASGRREQQAAIDTSRSPDERRRTELVYERQRMELAKRLLDLDKDQYERDNERAQFFGQSRAAGMGLAPIGLPLAGFAAAALGQSFGQSQLAQGTNRTLEELVRAQDAAMQKLIGAYDSAVTNITRLEGQLNAANPR
jgi:hypothetical protein